MLEILRNIARHRARTGLTVFGIVIGIFAVTVMGSMTEYFNQLIDNGIKLAGTAITVSPKGSLHSVITESDVRRIERVPGVKTVVPVVAARLEPGGSIQFGPPEQVIGEPPDLAHYVNPEVTRGRWLQRGDTYQAVIGVKIAKKRNLDLGSTLTWRDHDFTVVGIMRQTETVPDTSVIIPIEVERHILKQPNLIVQAYAVPQDGTPAASDALARRIQTEVDTVKVQTLEQQLDQVRQGLVVFNVIMLGGAIIAAIVGGLAVINTMIMSVNERTREIGLKKAIGASDGDIVKEFLTEAALIGLIGGLVGLALGTGFANLLNAATAESLGGTEIFSVTPRLALVALGFATFLGAGAGLYPAWNAARLNPVQALREE
jgi:putative ABC transport system permease protein